MNIVDVSTFPVKELAGGKRKQTDVRLTVSLQGVRIIDARTQARPLAVMGERKYVGRNIFLPKSNFVDEEEARNLECSICSGVVRDAVMCDNGYVDEVLMLKVHCDNRANGCKECVPLKDMPAHLRGCMFMFEECRLGCEKKVLRKDLAHHISPEGDCPLAEDECPEVAVPCIFNCRPAHDP
eukprot:gene19355-23142_t